MNDDLRVVVPDKPLDTSNPTVAKALLDLLRHFGEIERSSTLPFTGGENREHVTRGLQDDGPATSAPQEAAG